MGGGGVDGRMSCWNTMKNSSSRTKACQVKCACRGTFTIRRLRLTTLFNSTPITQESGLLRPKVLGLTH